MQCVSMEITSALSLVGTGLGVCSRVPQIHHVISRRSAADISRRALTMNIAANACFAIYAVDHAQYPILLNNFAVIVLDGTLLLLRNRYATMKKASSSDNLVEMDPPT